MRTARTDAERREALGVVCAVVRELSPPRDPASERALSLAEAWCRGKQVTRNDLSAAADKAFAFSAHSYVAYSADSAEAAVDETVTVYAAEAAADSAYAAARAARAAYAVAAYAAARAAAARAAAAAAASAVAAYAAAYAAAADAIRRRLPSPPAWVLSACEVTP